MHGVHLNYIESIYRVREMTCQAQERHSQVFFDVFFDWFSLDCCSFWNIGGILHEGLSSHERFRRMQIRNQSQWFSTGHSFYESIDRA